MYRRTAAVGGQVLGAGGRDVLALYARGVQRADALALGAYNCDLDKYGDGGCTG